MIRRDFVKNGAAFCAAASLPAILKAKNVNDKIGIALIGARRMGWDDLRWAFAAGGVECTAICDVDKPGAKEGGGAKIRATPSCRRLRKRSNKELTPS